MLGTASYSLHELLRERREGAVRAIIRVLGHQLAEGCSAEEVGRLWFQLYRNSLEFKRISMAQGTARTTTFLAQHLLDRWGWCDGVRLHQESGSVIVDSESMLAEQEHILGYHGVTRMDMEAFMETFWRQFGREVGLEVTYTIGDDQDWLITRAVNGGDLPFVAIEAPEFGQEALAFHRRLVLAACLITSIGLAKRRGARPEDLGLFFYNVWEGSGHYEKLSQRFGFGNALAYAQNIAQSRQVLYASTTLLEDLDGFTITSPSWFAEIPQTMAACGVEPADVYRYFAGGGVQACARLGLQYADQSDEFQHRVWIRSR